LHFYFTITVKVTVCYGSIPSAEFFMWLSFCSTLPLQACNPTFPFIPIIAFIGHRLRTASSTFMLASVLFLFRDSYLANFSRALGTPLGTGTSIPSLTALVSLRVSESGQGRLMGGTQTLLSLTYIIGPALAGISFEVIAFSAPYWLGSLLSVFALTVAHSALRGGRQPDEATSYS